MAVCCPHECPFLDTLKASIHSGTYEYPAGASLVGIERREFCTKKYIEFCPEVINPHICSPAELAESVELNTMRMPCTTGKRNE